MGGHKAPLSNPMGDCRPTGKPCWSPMYGAARRYGASHISPFPPTPPQKKEKERESLHHTECDPHLGPISVSPHMVATGEA